ncbi:MAG TPA: MotA/TolQ/ExbB proton channel family protein [Salinivirgaceae bacterium]|nr:MotA/TolQ/ExbB proton channel family protein [Salinivirgaceae bacterium]
MKKLLLFFTVIGMLSFGVSTNAMAQEGAKTTEIADTTQVQEEAATTEEATTAVAEEQAPQEGLVAVHQALKVKFIEGGPGFMATILLCLVLGLALAIERIIYLNLASTDTEKLLKSIEESLKNNNVEEAMETCRNTRGPVASIFYQGLSRIDEGMDVVEKSIVSYGSVQTGLMEKGLSWISLFIVIGPMLGFLGTVIGMVQAFDAIEVAGDISPTLVAGGIKVALITTIGGLIVAMILQVFYNYLIAKIDGIVGTMEDSSITLVDMITEYNKKK